MVLLKTLEILDASFPDTEVSRQAIVGLISAAVEAGQFNVAEKVLNRMLENSDAYGDDVYLSTGNGLLQAGQHGIGRSGIHCPIRERESRACAAGAVRNRLL